MKKLFAVLVIITLAVLTLPVSALTYEQMARYPEQYEGDPVTITGQVQQIDYYDAGFVVRMYTGKTEYGSYLEDDLFVGFVDIPINGRILEDDIITVTGVYIGLYTYDTVLGAPRTVPNIKAESYQIL